MKVVVLLSGGIDSTVALAEALGNGYQCLALTCDYGQSHGREINSATAVARHYDIPHSVIDITSAFKPNCPLTGHGSIPGDVATVPDATVVPGRNLVLLSLAIAHAESNAAGAVAIGANRDDLVGYPDCRPGFITAIDEASRLGTLNHVGVWAPHLGRTKAEVVQIGHVLGAPLYLTWSCYRGGVTPCGNCGACITNAKALA